MYKTLTKFRELRDVGKQKVADEIKANPIPNTRFSSITKESRNTDADSEKM